MWCSAFLDLPLYAFIYSDNTAQKWEPFQTWVNTLAQHYKLIDPAPHVGLPTRNRTYLEWPGLLRPASFSSTNRKASLWTIFDCLLRLKRIWRTIAGIDWHSPLEDSWSNDESSQSKEWFSLSNLDFLKLLSWLSGSNFLSTHAKNHFHLYWSYHDHVFQCSQVPG